MRAPSSYTHVLWAIFLSSSHAMLEQPGPPFFLLSHSSSGSGSREAFRCALAHTRTHTHTHKRTFTYNNVHTISLSFFVPRLFFPLVFFSLFFSRPPGPARPGYDAIRRAIMRWRWSCGACSCSCRGWGVVDGHGDVHSAADALGGVGGWFACGF